METSLLENVDEDNEDNDTVAENDLKSSKSQQEPIPEANEIARRRGLKSPAILLCISHALSAWGDRMWLFAIGYILIQLTPNSLRLTAVYGLCVSLSVVAIGPLVGDWIDVTPRLKAARLTLVTQNVAVVACAGVLLVMLISNIAKGLFYFLAFILIALASVAQLSSVGTTIAIERDWVVVIAQGDEALLAATNAKLRRIDLTCNILAPALTGLVFSFGSTEIGIIFLAGWNVLSLFFEYFILTSVHASCPALAIKNVDPERHGNMNKDDGNIDEHFSSLDLEESVSSDGITLVPRVKTVQSFKTGAVHLAKKVKARIRTLRFGVKLYFQQRVALAGLGLASLYLTVLGFNNITAGFLYSQHVSAFIYGVLTGAGALTGIIGTFIFPRARKIFGLVKTGIVSMSIQLFFLMFCVASVWAPGHPGHHADTTTTQTLTMSPTPVAITATILTSYVIPNVNNTIFKPTAVVPTKTLFPPYTGVAPMNISSGFNVTSGFLETMGSVSISPTSAAFFQAAMSATVNRSNNASNANRNPSSNTSPADNGPSSHVSLGLLIGGLVMSRTGLWMTDLVITQLFQENIAEQERGIVGGVQSSFNRIMDVAHFVMVTVAPKPEQFGALILVSFSMVSLGFAFYARFAWNFRKRLRQLEKLSQWSTSSESVDESSRRLRQENKSNSQEDIMTGMLTVENENYSS